jgi:methionyl-tRNA synthetase
MFTDKFACPCCGFLTLDRRGYYEVCPVCYWEDDLSSQNERSSANKLSLLEARQNFLRLGACEERLKEYVRAPLPEEQP